MKLFIVTEDLGDGDVGLRYFSTEEKAMEYMEKNEDWCYHESNPRELDVSDMDSFKYNDGE